MDNKFYHRTDNLEPLLNTGRIYSLRHLKQKSPKKEISVEPERWSRERKLLPAAKAYQVMKNKKDVDDIFMTKGAPLKGEDYGRYIIEKELKTPRPAENINFIPNEYKQKRFISLKRKANIYAPDKEVKKLQKKYPKYSIKPISDYGGEYLPDYDIPSFFDKVLMRIGLKKQAESLADIDEKNLRKRVSSKAHITGSRGLGLHTPDSDMDILVPYKSDYQVQKNRERLKQKYNLQESPYNYPGRSRIVLTNEFGDVVLTSSPEAQKYLEALARARSSLSDRDRSEILKEKQRLQDAWFFKNYRYNKFKRDLDRRLGIPKF